MYADVYKYSRKNLAHPDTVRQGASSLQCRSTCSHLLYWCRAGWGYTGESLSRIHQCLQQSIRGEKNDTNRFFSYRRDTVKVFVDNHLSSLIFHQARCGFFLMTSKQTDEIEAHWWYWFACGSYAFCTSQKHVDFIPNRYEPLLLTATVHGSVPCSSTSTGELFFLLAWRLHQQKSVYPTLRVSPPCALKKKKGLFLHRITDFSDYNRNSINTPESAHTHCTIMATFPYEDMTNQKVQLLFMVLRQWSHQSLENRCREVGGSLFFFFFLCLNRQLW